MKRRDGVVESVHTGDSKSSPKMLLTRNLTNEIAHTNRYRTDQHPFTIFRYPDDVHFKVRFRARSVPIVTHATTLPRPSLRLKARGFHHPRKGH